MRATYSRHIVLLDLCNSIVIYIQRQHRGQRTIDNSRCILCYRLALAMALMWGRNSCHYSMVLVLAVLVVSLLCILFQSRYVDMQKRLCVVNDCPSPRLVYDDVSRTDSGTTGYLSAIHILPHHMEPTLGKWLRAQQQDIQDEFKQLEQSGAEPDDPMLVAHARRVILPGSPHQTLKLNHQNRETPQSKMALELLNGKRGGFFIECGALNGERASNTMFLEQLRGWTGLLVEVDPFFFLQLLGHNRKAYSLNACLSPQRTISTLSFKESSGGLGTITSKGRTVPCYPLETLLLAINVTKVDFFSLDVEGQELAVLKTIPFDKLDITVLAVETAHIKEGRKACDAFMEARGYTAYKHITHVDEKLGLYVDDMIYVKKTHI